MKVTFYVRDMSVGLVNINYIRELPVMGFYLNSAEELETELQLYVSRHSEQFSTNRWWVADVSMEVIDNGGVEFIVDSASVSPLVANS